MFDAIKPYLVEIVPTMVVVIVVAIAIRRIGRAKVRERLKGKGPLIAGMVIAGIAVMVALQLAAVRLTTPDIDQLIADDPILSAMATAEPEQVDAVRDRLHKAAGRGERALLDEAAIIGREIGTTRLPDFIALATDQAVREFLDASLAALIEAAEQSGARCFTYLFGGEDPGLIPTFSPEVQQAMSRAMARVITEGGSERPGRILEEPALSDTLMAVMGRATVLAGKEPVDFDALANPQSVTGEEHKHRVCQAARFFYQAMDELPDEQAAPLVRTLLAAS